MQKIIISIALGTILLLGIYVCIRQYNKPSSQRPDVSHIALEVPVHRIEQSLFALSSPEELTTFLQKHTQFAQQFLGVDSMHAKEVMVQQLYTMIQDPPMQKLNQEVQSVFGSTVAWHQQLVQAFRYVLHYYPTFKVPQVATFITGMGKDLYVSEDLIVVGLDFFMGGEAQFRPYALPHYMLQTYQPNSIVPRIILLLAQQFIQTDPEDDTLLSDMIFYGKAYYFAQRMLPNVPEHVLLRYTAQQLQEVKQHQKHIWQHFIEKQLFYESNHFIKKRYTQDRPSTSEISTHCPGRIAHWLGWEIVRHYMEHNTHTDIPMLMCHKDVQDIFTKARYRPH